MLVGFRYPDGTALVDTKGAVLERLLGDVKRFEEYPFFYFYLARHSQDKRLIADALKSPVLVDAIAKGWIVLPKQYKAYLSSPWSKEEIGILSEMWVSGTSTASIARRLAKSRNAVTGKAKRLGLVRKVSDIAEGVDRTTSYWTPPKLRKNPEK
jgi:hypothetical protein